MFSRVVSLDVLNICAILYLHLTTAADLLFEPHSNLLFFNSLLRENYGKDVLFEPLFFLQISDSTLDLTYKLIPWRDKNVPSQIIRRKK